MIGGGFCKQTCGHCSGTTENSTSAAIVDAIGQTDIHPGAAKLIQDKHSCTSQEETLLSIARSLYINVL
jgi:hypothetical protein